MKHLTRSRNEKIIAGVCGGLAEYLEMDPVILRIIAIVSAIISAGLTVLAYLVCIVVIPLNSGENALSSRSNPASAARRDGQSSAMEGHVKVLGILYIVFGSMKLLAGGIVFMVLAAGGLISRNSAALGVTTFIGGLIAGLLLLFALPEIIGGLGVIRRRPWARIVLMVLGVLSLPAIPFGTALGVYSLWVLTNKETEPLFRNNPSY